MRESRWPPLLLVPVLVAADQAVKLIIVRTMRIGEVIEVWGDFLWLWHVRNKAMAFSLGHWLPDGVKSALFIVLPMIVVAAVLIYYFRSPEVSPFQRWCFAAIVGGGLGNLVDRIARAEGVVDYVSVRFYGLLGLERWPAFNVADSSVVVAGLLLLAGYLRDEIRSKR